MNNPLSIELTQLRQREMQEQAQAHRKTTITSQSSLPNALNAVMNALNSRTQKTSTADEQAHLAWVADQA